MVLHDIEQKDIARILELTKKYSDCPMDFADATLVITAEKTGIKRMSAETNKLRGRYIFLLTESTCGWKIKKIDNR